MNESSHIQNATYNHVTRTIKVQFKGGEIYEYPGVTKADNDAFDNAQSPGSFLKQWLIPRYGNGRRVSR